MRRAPAINHLPLPAPYILFTPWLMGGEAGLMRQQIVENARCIVVKLGTALLAAPEGGLDRDLMLGVAAQVARMLKDGRSVVLVSSGAIQAGLSRLGRDARPGDIAQIQSAAAVGQVELMQAW